MFTCLLQYPGRILIGMLLQGYETTKLLDYLEFKLFVLELLECNFNYFDLKILKD